MKFNLDGFEKSSNPRRTSFEIMRRAFSTLNACKTMYNTGVGLFAKPSQMEVESGN